ncbi:MAG: Type I restriction modification DNA specificity domain protein [Syntrophorhabdus sp. PtaU1.Bin153]|nr:MAG: Type I restriction modification DNA specificity domain protein [Syntrophorhabdus sp. PtaU1.Bin153]
MEATSGVGLVIKAHTEKDRALPRREHISSTVRLKEIIDAGTRLEASAFKIEARRAVGQLRASGLPLLPLYGPEGLCQEAHNAFRFKRIYVRPPFGIPFLSSSDIISMRPEIDRYVSKAQTKGLDELIVRKWDVLLTRSGTIGNIGLASDSFAGMALSEDAIRVRSRSPEIAGYVTAFLRSCYGRPQLKQATYGSVVQHIEPEHLTRVLIPEIDSVKGKSIGKAVLRAYELRDEANRMLEEADQLLHERLHLSPLHTLVPGQRGPVLTSVRASDLAFRLEASFHDPLARAAEMAVRSLRMEVLSLDDRRVAAEIRPITKFRKRVYVRKGGIPLLSSKQIFQIDPVDVKALAKGAHTKDLKEIALEEGMICISCSGTIGRVQIIPKYMSGWAANQHATRVLASATMNAGYLYAWLASDYGSALIKRHSYGSVILEVDKEMLGAIPVPVPEKEVMNEIGNLVIKANELRNEAWQIERTAIREIENAVSKTTFETNEGK